MYFQSSYYGTAFIFMNLFNVFEPLNRLLQGRDLDILAAVNHLKRVANNITLLRID